VDIVRRYSGTIGEWHHVATCENIETARTLVELMNIGQVIIDTEPKPKLKKERAPRKRKR